VKALFRFFAERHLLAYLITAMIVLLGLSALPGLKRDNLPDVDLEEMMISTYFPDASPGDVELKVTNSIEDELESVDGIEKVSSFSMEGYSLIHLNIDQDATDPEKVKREVRDAVARVSDLPVEVREAPRVFEITTSGIPVIEVGLVGEVPYRELREIARRLEKGLKRLSGVASVEKFGYLAREIKVEVSPQALAKYQIPVRELVEAIRARNVRSSAGSLESYADESNIVTLAQFRDPAEVGDVIVRTTFDGPAVRVRDVATVSDAFEPEKMLSRMNGRSAVSFLVRKKESADIIRTVDAVKGLARAFSARLPEGVEIHTTGDNSRIVRNRLRVVLSNGVIGLGLVMITLCVFLNVRSAFWVAVGIPVSLFGVIFFLPLFDASLNSISVGAMIIVIGIIVDDAIVISENIARHRARGAGALEASVEGISEVFFPVLTTIVTTMLAFAPMFFMSGIMGKFVYVIPLVVIIALAVSFVESTLALPAHLSAGPGAAAAAGRQWFDRLCRGPFSRLVHRAVRLRYPVVLAFAALLAFSFWYAFRYMDFVLFPTRSADEFHIQVELPRGASLEATSDKLREIERLVAALPRTELASFVTRIGTKTPALEIGGQSGNWAIVTVYLTPYSERTRNADEIVEELRAGAARIRGLSRVVYYIEGGGPPVGRPVTLRVVGSDDALRKAMASRVEALLKGMRGVKDVDRNDKTGKKEIEVRLDYDRLPGLGLSVADVARVLRLAYDGEEVTRVRYGDEDVVFRVVFEEQARRRAEGLARLPVSNRSGRLIPLGRFASLSTGPGSSDVYHFDGERAITITADVVKGETTPVRAVREVVSRLDPEREYPGMRLVVGGEAEETGASMQSLYIAFVVGLVAIYCVLVLLFNSLSQPFLVLAVVPFGMMGVIAAFVAHGLPLGFVGMLGVVGLTGVVVNDSLILVNFVNLLRARHAGSPLRDLVAEAAATRLRPILLTSVTTVSGLLPMAYGLGGSDAFMAPMALAMGYGILLATPITLILLPALLVIRDDLSRLVSGLTGRRSPGPRS